MGWLRLRLAPSCSTRLPLKRSAILPPGLLSNHVLMKTSGKQSDSWYLVYGTFVFTLATSAWSATAQDCTSELEAVGKMKHEKGVL